jgi:hypothetical protein
VAAYGAAAQKKQAPVVSAQAIGSQAGVVYPKGHKLGMRVPLGGSDCAKCEYVSGANCTHTVFIKWNGGAKIPDPVDEYCCDLFEARKGKEK